MRHRPGSPELVLGLLLLPLLGAALALGPGGPLAVEEPASTLALGLAGLSWLAAVFLAPRVPGSRALILAVVAGALALRLIFLAGDPEVTDDRQRYLWEAGLVLEGKSPYAWAPDAPELERERELWPEVHAGINHPEVSAAYPPVTQAAQALVVGLAGGPSADRAKTALRVFYAVADLLVLLPLGFLLVRRGRSPALLVTWAWCPLVALEFAGSGHFDSLGILFLWGGLAAFGAAATHDRRRRGAAQDLGAMLLAGGTMVKLLPALLLPFCLRWCDRPSRGLALFLGVCALCVAPLAFLEGGAGGLFTGFSDYSLRWESFNLVFRWIEAPFGAVFERDLGWSDPRRLGRAVVLLVWGFVALREWRAGSDALRAGFVTIGAFLVLTPTLHPWYVAWIVPFLAFHRSLAWSLLVVLAPLLYWPVGRWRAEGEWSEPTWMWPLVAGGFFLVLGVEALHARRAAMRA